MTSYTHQTAPTQFVEANGIRFAYRRFGKAPDFDPNLFLDGIDPQYQAELNASSGGVPLVFNQHYTGTMDYWDPAVTDALARDREVILFNNAGVSSSSGEVPTTFEEMGANAIAFIKALGLKRVDVLGFSIGGFVAQEITLQAPDLVRRLVLVGTGPRGGQNMATLTPEAQQIFGDNDVIVYSINSWILQQNIPNAQLIIYPDANHGSQYQYPQRFVRHVSDFLSEGEPNVSDFVSEFGATAPAVFESTRQS